MTADKNTFLKTTRKIVEYVGREYSDAGEYQLAMINLNLPALIEHQLPADVANTMAVEIWKMARCTYNKKIEARLSATRNEFMRRLLDSALKHFGTRWKPTKTGLTLMQLRTS